MMEEFFKNARREIIKTMYSADAIKVELEEKYQLKGGIVSPLYCNASVLEGAPETRSLITSTLLFWIGHNFKNVDAVVGVASGGVPWATMIANSKALYLLRAHSASKKHGLCNQIEGILPFDGAKVVVIDNLLTSGHSVLNVIDALREGIDGKKPEILAVITIFDWNFPSVNKRFEEKGIQKFHMISISELLDYGFENKLLSPDAEKQIKQFYDEQNSL